MSRNESEGKNADLFWCLVKKNMITLTIWCCLEKKNMRQDLILCLDRRFNHKSHTHVKIVSSSSESDCGKSLSINLLQAFILPSLPQGLHVSGHMTRHDSLSSKHINVWLNQEGVCVCVQVAHKQIQPIYCKMSSIFIFCTIHPFTHYFLNQFISPD